MVMQSERKTNNCPARGTEIQLVIECGWSGVIVEDAAAADRLRISFTMEEPVSSTARLQV